MFSTRPIIILSQAGFQSSMLRLCPAGEQLGPGAEEPVRHVRHLRGPAEGQGDLQGHLRLHREEGRR